MNDDNDDYMWKTKGILHFCRPTTHRNGFLTAALIIQTLWAAVLAVALLAAPKPFLESLGWQAVDAVCARIISVSYAILAATSYSAATRRRRQALESDNYFSTPDDDDDPPRPYPELPLFIFYHAANGVILLASVAGDNASARTPSLIVATIISFFFAMFWSYSLKGASPL